MSNSKTFQGPQGTLQQLSWTVTGLIQIRLCQILGLFKDHKGHSNSCHGLLLGSYRLGYVKFKDFSRTTRDPPTVIMDCYWAHTDKVMSNSKTFQGPQGTLQQLSWTVTGLIQIRLCQILGLFKDHKGHSNSYHGLLLGSYRLGYVKFKDF